MKTTILALLFGLAAQSFSHAQTASLAEASPAVRLFASDKQMAFPEVAQARLRREITSLLKSSNFHSGLDDKHRIFTFSGVQQDYRDTVASGEYLLMSLSPSQKIATTGGDVTAREIVVGLRNLRGRNTVFTIDKSGTIVGHAKYSGKMYMELKKTVAEFRP